MTTLQPEIRRASYNSNSNININRATMAEEDTYEIPLQDQRVFGAGIKRKRVQFVPSTSKAPSITTSSTPAKSVSDLYLKLVLPGDSKADAKEHGTPPGVVADETQVCKICSLPFSDLAPPVSGDEPETIDIPFQRPPSKPRPHEASLAHQVCLTHSHPPSHLDRNRKGLAYLSAHGWDPDARRGLGSSGQGIQFPIKTKPKDDKMGIGVVLPKPGEIMKKEKPKKLDAGKVKKLYEKDKRKTERLREMFYQNEDVDRYLGKE
ncbi:hypothetical protein LOCC1_G002231 [Lachnellula occidentalis]|uniref:G-patch domain-containing protein n=1 Tax=Lachnellula occidentalis TaxID=215460 RepID=A0A8H8S4Y2_9HELO|nr:hypothetical protein LOCC1_G002231 [Lachnellula occidentalis]